MEPDSEIEVEIDSVSEFEADSEVLVVTVDDCESVRETEFESDCDAVSEAEVESVTDLESEVEPEIVSVDVWLNVGVGLIVNEAVTVCDGVIEGVGVGVIVYDVCVRVRVGAREMVSDLVFVPIPTAAVYDSRLISIHNMARVRIISLRRQGPPTAVAVKSPSETVTFDNKISHIILDR